MSEAAQQQEVVDAPITIAALPTPPAQPPPSRFAALALDLPRDTVPPVSDARWWGWTRPLSDYLSAPRTWAELVQWGKGQRIRVEVLRHLLAALEYMGEADTVGSDHWLTWMHRPLPRRTRSRALPAPAKPKRAPRPKKEAPKKEDRPSEPPPAEAAA